MIITIGRIHKHGIHINIACVPYDSAVIALLHTIFPAANIGITRHQLVGITVWSKQHFYWIAIPKDRIVHFYCGCILQVQTRALSKRCAITCHGTPVKFRTTSPYMYATARGRYQYACFIIYNNTAIKQDIASGKG